MFSLHETTRIWICRAAFVALCLVTTGMVAAWCLAVHLPHYRHGHEEAIYRRLGWHATLHAASTPRPALLLYEGLELSDPASRQLLVRAPFVEVQNAGNAASVTLAYPATINGLRLDALLHSAEQLLQAERHAGPIALRASSLTLHLDGVDRTLNDVEGSCEWGGDQHQIRASFRVASAGEAVPSVAQPVVVEVSLQPKVDSQGECVVKVVTGSAPLPCDLIASWWPAAKRLGPGSTFSGSITGTRTDGRWKLELSGTIDQIDLVSLIAPFPHTLSGTGQLTLDRATVEDGRLVSATGKLIAGPGTISRSLVDAAQNNLQLGIARRTLLSRGNRIAYQQLNLAFDVDATGLSLRGEIPEADGALLVDAQHVVVRQAAVDRLPVVNLLRTLVPQTTVQVPATRETAPLTAFLPVPPVMAPPGSEAPLPGARKIRIGPQ